MSERRQLEVRLGYGFGLFGDRYTGTPEVGFGLSEAHRETVLGWRLAEVSRAGLVFELGIEGARREPVGGGSGAERRLVVSLGWRLGHVRRQDVDFEIGLEATHREVANDNREAEQGIGLRLIWRW